MFLFLKINPFDKLRVNAELVEALIKIVMYQSIQKFLNKEKSPIVAFQKTTKEEFLLEHNRLSPLNMQTTISLLSRFRVEKASLFKDDNWSIDKLRRPFIFWLTSTSFEKKSKKIIK